MGRTNSAVSRLCELLPLEGERSVREIERDKSFDRATIVKIGDL